MKYLFFIMFSFFILCVSAQDIEKVKSNKPVTITGGLGLNLSGYDASPKTMSRRDPFSWDLNGNVNINVYGIFDLPFSIYLTKRNTTYDQPSFQQYGMSPKYKWITVHAGYRNIQFSSYSLSGTTFLGGGVEIQPQNSWISGKVLYGRFIKPTLVGDTVNQVVKIPKLERWGFGSMVTIGKTNNSVDLFVFKADDKMEFNVADSLVELKPMENLVIGFASRQKFLQRISLNVEYNLSAFSKDTRVPEKKFDTHTYVNNLGFLFTPRYSSTFDKAISTSADYQGDGYSLGVAFKWIDPGYQSLGALYLANDVMDYTINASKSLFQNKVNISASIGEQVNNLKKDLNVTNTRTISSFTFSYSITKNLNTSANYSNFNANSLPTKVIISDSIKYAQISKNIGGNISYNIGGKTFQHATSLNAALQTANTINESFTAVSETGTDMKNASFSYRVTYKPVELSINSSYSYSAFTADSLLNVTRGPVLGLMKAFWKRKLSTNISCSILGTYKNGSKEGNVNVLNGSISCRLGKHHSVRLNNSAMFKSSKDPSNPALKRNKEFKGSISYSYNF